MQVTIYQKQTNLICLDPMIDIKGNRLVDHHRWDHEHISNFSPPYHRNITACGQWEQHVTQIQARLELRVLGGFELRRDGQPVQWPRAAPRQLLKRLAVSERQAMTADEIAEAFWPYDSGDRVMRRRHQLVYLLRKTLQLDENDDSCLRIDDGIVRLLAGGSLWIDVVAFELLLDPAQAGDDERLLEQALALYRGRLLGNEPNEEWLVAQRNRVEGRFIAAALRLATLRTQQDRIQAATNTLSQLLAHVPAHEPAHRELITLYGRIGRTEDVHRQFSECTTILQRELDAEPSAETHSAYQAALAPRVAAEPGDQHDARRSVSHVAAQAGTAARWTAPHPLVDLLGRDEAIRSTVQQLHDGVRLLNLAGVGGVGKTQLAIRIAHEVQHTYAQGACFVPLAEVRPGELYTAIARALGLKLLRQEEPKATVQRLLEHSDLLLVLDNFEHMASEAGELALLLQHCAGLVLLVTSRIRLNLAAETCVAVPPLQVARNGAEHPHALRLFIGCAGRIRPELELTNEEVEEAWAITCCLGGLPLSIELAAARLPLFTFSDLRKAIEASFEVISGGGGDRPARQRSLRHSFSWSYALLSSAEQSLLLLLGLCDSSFDRHDARGLAGDDAGDPDLKLQTLVELGFVTHEPRHQKEIVNLQESRFGVTPAVREFVRKEVELHAACAELRLRFINHFIDSADRLDAEIEVDDPRRTRQALLQFAAVSPNFFAALNFAQLAHRQADVCRLVTSLARLWGDSGMWHGTNYWIEWANQHVNALEPEQRAPLALKTFEYWRRHGLLDKALAAAKQAVHFAEDVDQPAILFKALIAIGASYIATAQISVNEISSLLRRARLLLVRLPDAHPRWMVASSQAMIYFDQGNLRRAGKILEICNQRNEPTKHDEFKVMTKWSLANVLYYNGRPAEALANLEWTLTAIRGRPPDVLARAYLWAGWFYCSQINVVKARHMAHLAEEAISNFYSNQLHRRLPISLLEGRIALLEGKNARSLELLQPAVLGRLNSHDSRAAFDAPLWCFRAAICASADAVAAKALSRALEARLRWPRENPRILEAASTWLAGHEHEDAAAVAWLQADAIRRKNGIVRFPAEQHMAEQTCAKLAERLGPDWCSKWRPKTPALAGDDPVGWLLGALASCSAKQSRPQAAATT
jgi:DNA-binding SARP family transcriptional activator/predicted ATPase